MYLDFVGDLDELYAACRIGYDVNAPQGMALIAEIQRQDSLIGALQADNMRLRGLIAEAVEDMGRGSTCIHAGLKGRMVQAMAPNDQHNLQPEAVRVDAPVGHKDET